MVSLQVISRILDTKDMSLYELNNLSTEHFVGYEHEIQFIVDHYLKYKIVPDKETFLSNFPEFELVQVSEADRYLIDTIQEEYLYHKFVPVIQKTAKLLQSDSRAANEYLQATLRTLTAGPIQGIDIAHNREQRLEIRKNKKERKKDFFFTCGFPELDDAIHGINREVELFVIFARTNQGKSWVLEKMCTHIWQTGYNVGYISPEMTVGGATDRFDTLVGNFSNRALMWGEDIDETKYEDHLNAINQSTAKFMVASMEDFDRKITVSKLRSFIQTYELQLLAIDGITYMTDERYNRGDNKATSLTNIAEDLRELSIELSIPILIVVQSNRTGVRDADDNDTPDLESIRDSDGISHNATKVLSLRQLPDNKLIMEVRKNTYGKMGSKLQYRWDIDSGIFEYDGGDVDGTNIKRIMSKKQKTYNSKEDVF